MTRNVAKDPAQTKIIADYGKAIAPIASKVIGHINADVTRAGNPAGESALGDLIADAQLNDPSVVGGFAKPVIAFMNPGGIRADLTAGASKWGEPVGDVTFEEAFTVQPFNNYLVSMDLKGSDIYALLTQQVTGANSGASAKKTLQVSAGFTYTMSPTGTGRRQPEARTVSRSTRTRPTGSSRTTSSPTVGTTSRRSRTAPTSTSAASTSTVSRRYLPTVSPYTPAPPTRISGNN